MRLTDLAESVVMTGSASRGFAVRADGTTLGRVRRVGAGWEAVLEVPTEGLVMVASKSTASKLEALEEMIVGANAMCARLAFGPA